MRKQVTVEMSLFRENSLVNHLSADLHVDGKLVHTYYRAPKAFKTIDDAAFNAGRTTQRVHKITMTVNEDYSNPRCVKLAEQGE